LVDRQRSSPLVLVQDPVSAVEAVQGLVQDLVSMVEAVQDLVRRAFLGTARQHRPMPPAR